MKCCLTMAVSETEKGKNMFGLDRRSMEKVATENMHQLNPHLSVESARYLATVVVSVMLADIDAHPEVLAIRSNEILLARLYAQDKKAHAVVREDLKKYRPAYEEALSTGSDPVVALAMSFPLGGSVARQYVSMFQLVDAPKN